MFPALPVFSDTSLSCCTPSCCTNVHFFPPAGARCQRPRRCRCFALSTPHLRGVSPYPTACPAWGGASEIETATASSLPPAWPSAPSPRREKPPPGGRVPPISAVSGPSAFQVAAALVLSPALGAQAGGRERPAETPAHFGGGFSAAEGFVRLRCFRRALR